MKNLTISGFTLKVLGSFALGAILLLSANPAFAFSSEINQNIEDNIEVNAKVDEQLQFLGENTVGVAPNIMVSEAPFIDLATDQQS